MKYDKYPYKLKNIVELSIKVIISMVLLITSFSGLSSIVSASWTSNIKVFVNNQSVKGTYYSFIDDQSHITYIPLRDIVDYLGLNVNYTSNQNPITLTVKKPVLHELVLTLNSKKIIVDGVVKTISGAPIVDNGHIMIPLRALTEGFGATFVLKPANYQKIAELRITVPWTTPTWEWKLSDNQRITGPIVFNPMTWDEVTRTLKFKLPSNIINGKETWGVSAVLQNGEIYDTNTKYTKFTLDKQQILSNLDVNFILYIEISSHDKNGNINGIIDRYYMMSKVYAKTHYPYKGTIDNEPIVYDSEGELITLGTIYKVLGISD
ncbi:copper amine oxidase domain-containing protein [Paenibacillus sp. FSL R7-269]|uniref:copper amine oxidase N-terminal domain-containing protein n=1 Tax=Paenibacillus sp. FSL R7-269 TaxID=1226755 RepID=UPI0003E218CB|nr:copper amine oxidase N-terminal domain-containing protein [Paenibacillus sp. FSL R7-269]ETT53140.1 copper amine oxidase domain-containing protein [Paenibacillus sp. FSL R7-269]